MKPYKAILYDLDGTTNEHNSLASDHQRRNRRSLDI